MSDGVVSAVPGRRYRAWVYAFGMAVSAAVLSPVFRNPPADSFPLSDYPMFSHGRPDSSLTLTHALGLPPTGPAIPLSPGVSAGTSEVLQSMVTIGRSVHEGRGESFCREIAERVKERSELDSIVEVQLATSRYDCVRYFDEARAPLERTIHARCAVER